MPDPSHRDDNGEIRVLSLGPDYGRMINRAYDKIRQAGAGMPAVSIRLMESLSKVFAYTVTEAQRAVLVRQAAMVLRGSEAGITEPNDLYEVRSRYARFVPIGEVSLDGDEPPIEEFR